MTSRLAFLIFLILCVAAAPSERFFPARPRGVVLSMQEGVLVQYRVGDLAGILMLRVRGGREITFNLGQPIRIDGREVTCKIAPTDDAAPSTACPDWPANVVVGRTRVQVIYRHVAKSALKEQDVLVTDEIKTLETSAALPRATAVTAEGL